MIRNPNKTLLVLIIIFSFSIFLLLANDACAIPMEEWNVTFKGMEYEASSIVQTSDGGYLIAAFTFTLETSFDVWLIKIDSNGKEQWRKLFKGQHWDWIGSIQQTKDSGYILAGFTESHEWGNRDAWLVKTDEQGIEEWSKRFGGVDTDYAASVQLTEDGGYAITGATRSFGSGNQDAWIIKTDAKGNQEWRKIFGGTSDDGAYTIQKTIDKGYVIAGWTDSYGAGSYDALVIKVDENGNKQWDKTFGGSEHEEASSIQQTLDGGYIIAGFTKSYGAGNADAWLIKTDAKGNEEWNKTFGEQSDDRAWSIQQTSAGGYIMTGSKTDDAWIIETDAIGNEDWSKTFGGSDPDEAYSIVQTSGEGYVVAGRTRHGLEAGDAWLIKISNKVTQTTTPTPTPATTLATTPPPPIAATTSTPGFEVIFTIIEILVMINLIKTGSI